MMPRLSETNIVFTAARVMTSHVPRLPATHSMLCKELQTPQEVHGFTLVLALMCALHFKHRGTSAWVGRQRSATAFASGAPGAALSRQPGRLAGLLGRPRGVPVGAQRPAAGRRGRAARLPGLRKK